jgi:hypothetical protein
MNKEEFAGFVQELQRILGTSASSEVSQQIYIDMSKLGFVHFAKFELAFGKWCDEQVKETLGTEVVHPISLQDPPNKEFNITLQPSTQIYKKFTFTNRESYDKTLTVSSSNENLLQVRTPNLVLQSQNGLDYIRVKISAPKLPGDYLVQVLILDSETMSKEELILFRITIPESREVSPSLRSNLGGNINKNAGGWMPSMRSPSPRRNTPEPR